MPTTEDYISILAAVAKLQKAMFATLRRTADVEEIKKLLRLPKLSVTSGLHLEEAKKTVRDAAMKGNLPVYAQSSERGKETYRIPYRAIAEIPSTRNGLPSDLTRIIRGEHYSDLVPFLGCELMVRSNEFADWMESEKRKLKWRSQTKSKRRPVGRPSLFHIWKDRIVATVDGARSEAGLNDKAVYPVTAAAIARRLSKQYRDGLSEDSVARMLDQLFFETSNPAYRRPTRSRKIPSSVKRSC